MNEFFVIRDPNSYGDVALTWNYRKRGWCWDLDGDYTADDGFAYFDRQSALNRARMITLQESHNPDVLRREGRKPSVNVRVVSRKEFNAIREERNAER